MTLDHLSPADQRAIAEALAEVRAMPGVSDVRLIGSALYLPSPKDHDFAVLVPVQSQFLGLQQSLAEQVNPWSFCSEDYKDMTAEWTSLRRNSVNLMITQSLQFFNDYCKAMEVCKVLNLVHKRDRIAVCQIIRDGKTADDILAARKIADALFDDEDDL